MSKLEDTVEAYHEEKRKLLCERAAAKQLISELNNESRDLAELQARQETEFEALKARHTSEVQAVRGSYKDLRQRIEDVTATVRRSRSRLVELSDQIKGLIGSDCAGVVGAEEAEVQEDP